MVAAPRLVALPWQTTYPRCLVRNREGHPARGEPASDLHRRRSQPPVLLSSIREFPALVFNSVPNILPYRPPPARIWSFGLFRRFCARIVAGEGTRRSDQRNGPRHREGL